MKIDTKFNFDAFDETKSRRVDFWNESINPNENGPKFSDEEINNFYDLIAEKRLLNGCCNRWNTLNVLDSFYAFARKCRCCCCCVTK